MIQTIKAVTGVTEVYDSREAQGFEQAAEYPIAWEIMYRNDSGGQVFARQLQEALNALPSGKAMPMAQEEAGSEAARSAEIAFADLDSFRQVVHAAFNGLTLCDEQQRSVIPRQQLIDTARPFVKVALAASV